ncbi:hypothetical protein B4114_2347 [Geobacillus stearothermophilus]|uniref:Uncharacterized protein n=1 Tax=Geobacillus stearothermophilus TaxID=1422 RepID=A0A150NC23_GEOSE|nr:hypothetical protein B4114_2347 [Geobacillus stearothermophilus]
MDFDHPLSPLLRDQHLVYIYGDNQLFRLKKRKTSNVSRLQGCAARRLRRTERTDIRNGFIRQDAPLLGGWRRMHPFRPSAEKRRPLASGDALSAPFDRLSIIRGGLAR